MFKYNMSKTFSNCNLGEYLDDTAIGFLFEEGFERVKYNDWNPKKFNSAEYEKIITSPMDIFFAKILVFKDRIDVDIIQNYVGIHSEQSFDFDEYGNFGRAYSDAVIYTQNVLEDL